MYGASKAAIKLFSEGLRSELVGTKVGVCVLFPGAIATNMPVNSGIMTSQEAAAIGGTRRSEIQNDAGSAGWNDDCRGFRIESFP
jgi:short-subunit dehydrogenase